VSRAQKISLAKNIQQLEKMSKNATTSITGLNLLLYVACNTMRILVADKIKFLLRDMYKVSMIQVMVRYQREMKSALNEITLEFVL
jgi:hypothetical protein